MTPTSALLDELAVLLAHDATTLANAMAVKVHLAIAAFVPSNNLTVASFTEATFTGYVALAAGGGNQQEFVDPTTGSRVIQLNEPAGGWHWATSGAGGLPMTVYGFYVTDNAGATLYGSQLLPAPVTLTASGQGIDIPQVRFTMVLQPIT